MIPKGGGSIWRTMVIPSFLLGHLFGRSFHVFLFCARSLSCFGVVVKKEITEAIIDSVPHAYGERACKPGVWRGGGGGASDLHDMGRAAHTWDGGMSIFHCAVYSRDDTPAKRVWSARFVKGIQHGIWDMPRPLLPHHTPLPSTANK